LEKSGRGLAEVLLWQLLRATQENHRNPESGQPVARPEYERHSVTVTETRSERNVALGCSFLMSDAPSPVHRETDVTTCGGAVLGSRNNNKHHRTFFTVTCYVEHSVQLSQHTQYIN
jgi:hypothetical protein